MNLSRKTILITGGTSGIGQALTLALLAQGNTVIVTGRNEVALEAARQQGCIALKCDLTQQADIEQLVLWLGQEFPDLDVLINNAGVQHNYLFTEESNPYGRIRQETETNLTGPIILTTMLLPLFLRRQEALIANVTSALALNPKTDGVVYSATKAGFQSFSRGLRYQLEGTGIRVVEIMPPLVDTPMTQGRGKQKISPEIFAAVCIRGMEQGKAFITVPKLRLYRLINRWLPGVAAKMVR